MNKCFVCANDIIELANDENRFLTPQKLLKLAYFLFGHYYAKTGRLLFEEKFQAWQYGPVIPSLYEKIKQCGANNILPCNDGLCYLTNAATEYGKEYYEILEYVWEKYKRYSGAVLSDISHGVNSPWEITFNKIGEYGEIDNSLIERYFKGEALN